jgi:aspartyl-tRNA(Asn)/glutamyl-tRNA(Gln) amidotransferase subunit B
VIERGLIEKIRSELPELPDQKRDRFVKDFGLSRADAGVVTASKSMAAFLEQAVQLGDASLGKIVANLLTGETSRLLNEEGIDIAASVFRPKQFAELAKLVNDKTVSATAAKQIIAILHAEGKDGTGDVNAIVDREGLKQVNDLSALEPVIDRIIASNPKQVEEFRSGKEKILGFFVGQAMKATQGKANPAMLQDLVLKKLKGE